MEGKGRGTPERRAQLVPAEIGSREPGERLNQEVSARHSRGWKDTWGEGGPGLVVYTGREFLSAASNLQSFAAMRNAACL